MTCPVVPGNKLVRYILGLVFPPKCIFCGTLLHPLAYVEICPLCYKEIPFVKGKTCTTCGKPIDKPFGPAQCLDCRDRKNYFAWNVSPCEYRGIIREAIVRFKFFGKRRYARTLGSLMLYSLRRKKLCLHDVVVVYTPLHKEKLKERGFNQAKLLAEVIAQGLGCTLGRDILLKIKNTPPQSSLSRGQRMQNLRGAFRLNKNISIAGKNILLVDDVYTTGTTINECARLLIKAGAKEVYAVTAAIGRGID